MKTILQYTFSLTLVYIVATAAGKFIERSFTEAARNIEQMGERK